MMLDPDVEEQSRYQAVQAVDVRAEDAADRLIRALYDESWRVRRRAAERLSELTRPGSTLPRLIEVLADRDHTGARNAAAEALVGIGAQAIPPLTVLLQSPDPDQRKFAADILGLIRDPDASPALVAALSDEDANVRVSVVEALGLTGGPEAPRALETCLSQPDALLRLAAVEALTRLQAPPPLPVLVKLLEEPALRRVAVRALGLVRQPAAVREIVRTLQAPGRVVREAALGALGMQAQGAEASWLSQLEREVRPPLRQAHAALAPVLEEALGAEDVEARRGALFCLSLLGEPAFALRVAAAAEDDRIAEDVLFALTRMGPAAARILAEQVETLGAPSRQVVAEAIARSADASLVPALRALANSAEPELRLAAVVALGKAGASEAVAPLVDALADASLSAPATRALLTLAGAFEGDVRRALENAVASGRAPAALHALAQLGGEGSLSALRSATRHEDARVRAAAAKAAGEVGASDLLRVGLADESVEVRTAAARALGRAPPEDVSALLQRLLEDPEPQVRDAALESAAEAGDASLLPQLRDFARAPAPRRAVRAMEALARLGGLDARTLDAAEAHPEPEVLRVALVLGAALPEGVALARRSLGHERWEVRAAAARVMGASGGPADLAAVEAALGAEGDALVREALDEARAQLRRR